MQADATVHTWSDAQIDASLTKLLSKAVTISSYANGVVSLNNAYYTEAPPPASTDTEATTLHVHYKSETDNDANTLFQFGYVLPSAWVQTIVHTTETLPQHDGWCVHLDMSTDVAPDCVYKMCVYMFSDGAWDVVQDHDFIWDTHGLPMVLDGHQEQGQADEEAGVRIGFQPRGYGPAPVLAHTRSAQAGYARCRQGRPRRSPATNRIVGEHGTHTRSRFHPDHHPAPTAHRDSHTRRHRQRVSRRPDTRHIAVHHTRSLPTRRTHRHQTATGARLPTLTRPNALRDTSHRRHVRVLDESSV